MPTIQLSPIWLLAPAFLIGAYLGFRRGWQTEAITAFGLALAFGLLWNGPGLLLGVINRLLAFGARLVVVVGGGGGGQNTPPEIRVGPAAQANPAPAFEISISPAFEPALTLGLLALLTVGVYLLAGRMGRSFKVDRASRWFGAVIGGLNLFILMSRIMGGLNQSGTTPSTVDGLTVTIPSFPGLSIVVPPPPTSALLVNWPLTALIVLLVAMLVFALVRMVRA